MATMLLLELIYISVTLETPRRGSYRLPKFFFCQLKIFVLLDIIILTIRSFITKIINLLKSYFIYLYILFIVCAQRLCLFVPKRVDFWVNVRSAPVYTIGRYVFNFS